MALLLFVIVAILESHLLQALPSVSPQLDCPLEFSWANFTLAASACSNQNERAKCCRYINAIVAVSVARYANVTGVLGVPSTITNICLSSVSKTLELNGISMDATIFCGLGPKIRVSYQCLGRETVSEMLQSPNFDDIIRSCRMPLKLESSCRRCLNSSIIYLHHLIGAQDNVTLNTCRDAAFVSLANQGDNLTALHMASCFFSARHLSILPDNASKPSQAFSPISSPSPMPAQPPTQHLVAQLLKQHHAARQLALILGIGIMVIAVVILLIIILVLLIFKKSRKLNTASGPTETSWNVCSPQFRKCPEGASTIFHRFSYKETKKATNHFSSIIERAEFHTIYKAQFADGSIATVKRINQVLDQNEEKFCRDMVLLGILHHRHLVALRGYCLDRRGRFLIYEYMENGSLKDHLQSKEKSPLAWHTRIQIAIDVANALEYLHTYCDPPLHHGDIRSSNILLDENLVAKVSGFGLVHASRSGTAISGPVNASILENSGYVDPEYVAGGVLAKESDVYSYGVLLLELIAGARAVHDDQSLVEWSQRFMASDATIPGLVDPAILDDFDVDQLRVMVGVVKRCTRNEGRSRPSIKQVLGMLYEGLDLMPVSKTLGEEGYNEGKGHEAMIHHNGLHSSSSTTRSYCSRSVLLECRSPQSPSGPLSD